MTPLSQRQPRHPYRWGGIAETLGVLKRGVLKRGVLAGIFSDVRSEPTAGRVMRSAGPATRGCWCAHGLDQCRRRAYRDAPNVNVEPAVWAVVGFVYVGP